MPYCDDQPDNAARMERLGTSRTIDRQEYQAERVVEELQEILGKPKYATKAAEVSLMIQAEDGVKLACDAIVDQLAKLTCYS